MIMAFLILEVAFGFLFGAMCGVFGISFRRVVFFACVIFAVAVMADPLILPFFFHDMNFLLFGSGIIVVYFVLGRAIYGTVNATAKGAEKGFRTFRYLVSEEVEEKKVRRAE